MKRSVLVSAILGVCAVLTACAGGSGGRRPYEGTWYEQEAFGGTLEVRGSGIRYTAHENRFTDETTFRAERKDGKTELVFRETDFFYFADAEYDPKEDAIVCHTLPVMDGDGGYHRREFRREPYVAPTPPVYDPPADHSDPDAKKEFPDLTIRSMQVSFYDEGAEHNPDSNMAAPPPYAGDYSYDLRVLDSGEAEVSSSFCRQILLSREKTDALQELARSCGIGSVNGLDIHTEGLPYGSPEYELTMELASGETIRSSANGESVPEVWKQFQSGMHDLLFFAFVDAGYQYGSGEFHSTAPMKRLEAPDRNEATAASGISVENVMIVPDWEKSYDYSLDSKYFAFSAEEGKYPALMETLDRLSAEYRAIAEKTLEEDYRLMENAPKSKVKKADRLYCYSLYAADRFRIDGKVFSFTVSTGRANSLGIGGSGYGDYGYVRYHIDMETGRVLTLGDLFVSPEAFSDFLTAKMVGEFGTHHDAGRRIHSDAFPAALREAVARPEPEGIGWNVSYHSLTLWMPRAMFPEDSSQLMEVLYYDEIQDLLSDGYTQVW